jgi:hypothetical protein
VKTQPITQKIGFVVKTLNEQQIRPRIDRDMKIHVITLGRYKNNSNGKNEAESPMDEIIKICLVASNNSERSTLR